MSWKCVVTSSGYSKGKEGRVHRHFSFSSRKMPFPLRGKPTSLFPSGNPAETSGGVRHLQIPTREVSCRQLLLSSFGHVNTPSRQRSMGPYYLSEFRIGCEKRKILEEAINRYLESLILPQRQIAQACLADWEFFAWSLSVKALGISQTFWLRGKSPRSETWGKEMHGIHSIVHIY